MLPSPSGMAMRPALLFDTPHNLHSPDDDDHKTFEMQEYQ
jgi:hypothetical protein